MFLADANSLEWKRFLAALAISLFLRTIGFEMTNLPASITLRGEAMDRVVGAKYFTKLDIIAAYNMIRIRRVSAGPNNFETSVPPKIFGISASLLKRAAFADRSKYILPLLIPLTIRVPLLLIGTPFFENETLNPLRLRTE